MNKLLGTMASAAKMAIRTTKNILKQIEIQLF